MNTTTTVSAASTVATASVATVATVSDVDVITTADLCPVVPVMGHGVAAAIAPTFEAAFKSTARARAKLEPTALVPINLEIPSAIATVMASLPRARTLHAQMVTLFTAAEVAELDALETYADALAFAHTAFLAASQPAPPLHQLFVRATELRDTLLSDATALANRGLLDGRVLSELKGGTGYLAVAYDLGAIVRLMRSRWSEIGARTAVTEAELSEAEGIYEQVTRAFAARERQSDAANAASLERARAFTLFFNAYDQLRRAASFLRWKEEDADKFVPSLYAGRGGRGSSSAKSGAGASNGAAASTAGSSASAISGASEPGASGTDVLATATSHGGAAGSVSAAGGVQPGMPGGSPFSS